MKYNMVTMQLPEELGAWWEPASWSTNNINTNPSAMETPINILDFCGCSCDPEWLWSDDDDGVSSSWLALSEAVADKSFSWTLETTTINQGTCDTK